MGQGIKKAKPNYLGKMHNLSRWAKTVQLDKKTNTAKLVQLVQESKMAKTVHLDIMV